MKRKRIDYDDDIVIVKDPTGDIIYKGMEDYEPMKDEPWVFNEKKGLYELDGYTKKLIV